MENMLGGIIFFCITMVLFYRLWEGIKQRRTVHFITDKSLVFISSEISYFPKFSDEFVDKIKKKINGDDISISIPFRVLFRSMFLFHLGKLRVLHIIISLVLASTIFGSFFVIGVFPINKEVISYVMNNLDLMPYFLLLIVSFFLMFKSYSFEVLELDINVTESVLMLKKLGWGDLSIEVLKCMEEEIKLDYDRFMKPSSIYTAIYLLISGSLLFWTRSSGLLDVDFVEPIIVLVGIAYVFKWLYEDLRARIVYIGLNAIYNLKKQKIVTLN